MGGPTLWSDAISVTHKTTTSKEHVEIFSDVPSPSHALPYYQRYSEPVGGLDRFSDPHVASGQGLRWGLRPPIMAEVRFESETSGFVAQTGAALAVINKARHSKAVYFIEKAGLASFPRKGAQATKANLSIPFAILKRPIIRYTSVCVCVCVCVPTCISYIQT